MASYAENPHEDLRSGRAERTRASGDEAAGRAEGEDDMAQAGEAATQGKPRGKAVQSNVGGKGPVEVKSPSDPFGD